MGSSWPWWIRTTINGSKVAREGEDLTDHPPFFNHLDLIPTGAHGLNTGNSPANLDQIWTTRR